MHSKHRHWTQGQQEWVKMSCSQCSTHGLVKGVNFSSRHRGLYGFAGWVGISISSQAAQCRRKKVRNSKMAQQLNTSVRLKLKADPTALLSTCLNLHHLLSRPWTSQLYCQAPVRYIALPGSFAQCKVCDPDTVERGWKGMSHWGCAYRDWVREELNVRLE